MQVYNASIRISPQGGGTPVVLPVDNIVIRAVPYTADGPTVVTLFRGERIFVPPAFGYEIEMSWKNLSSQLPLLRDAYDLWTQSPSNVLVKHLFVEETTPGNFDAAKYVPDVIPDVTSDVFAVTFEERFRRKRASVKFVSRFQNLPLYDWVTDP